MRAGSRYEPASLGPNGNTSGNRRGARTGDRQTGPGGGGGRNGGGRTARVVPGRGGAADGDGVVLDIEGEQRGFGFAELGPGKVQVEFRRDDIGESRGH